MIFTVLRLLHRPLVNSPNTLLQHQSSSTSSLRMPYLRLVYPRSVSHALRITFSAKPPCRQFPEPICFRPGHISRESHLATISFFQVYDSTCHQSWQSSNPTGTRSADISTTPPRIFPGMAKTNVRRTWTRLQGPGENRHIG